MNEFFILICITDLILEFSTIFNLVKSIEIPKYGIHIVKAKQRLISRMQKL